MKTGMSGTVRATVRAATHVHRGEADHHRERDDRREGDLREVAGEVAVERVEAARREQDDLAAARLRRPARAERRRRASGAAVAGPT